MADPTKQRLIRQYSMTPAEIQAALVVAGDIIQISQDTLETWTITTEEYL
jgi:hypothetical protein